MYDKPYKDTSYHCLRQECILDPWIIQEINRQERQKRDYERPVKEITDDRPAKDYDVPAKNQQKEDGDTERGVIIIDDEGNVQDDTSQPIGTIDGVVIDMR